VIEHSEELGELIGGPNVPKADIADHLIAWAGLSAGCSHTVTFDQVAAGHVAGMELLA
jgi:predicted nucleic-acid-binding protein